MFLHLSSQHSVATLGGREGVTGKLIEFSSSRLLNGLWWQQQQANIYLYFYTSDVFIHEKVQGLSSHEYSIRIFTLSLDLKRL